MSNLLDVTLLTMGDADMYSQRCLLNKNRIISVTEGDTNTEILFNFLDGVRLLTVSGTGLDVLYRPEWDKTLTGTIIGVGSDSIGKDTNGRTETQNIVWCVEDSNDTTRSFVYTNDGLRWVFDLNLDAVVSAIGVVRKYKAILTQTGTNAPVVTVLEDTTGLTITPAYSGVGQYRLLSTFDKNKTLVTISGGISTGLCIAGVTETHIQIETYTYGETSFSLQNGVLSNTSLIIEIYP